MYFSAKDDLQKNNAFPAAIKNPARGDSISQLKRGL